MDGSITGQVNALFASSSVTSFGGTSSRSHSLDALSSGGGHRRRRGFRSARSRSPNHSGEHRQHNRRMAPAVILTPYYLNDAGAHHELWFQQNEVEHRENAAEERAACGAFRVLPDDVIADELCAALDIVDVGALASTCKRLHRVCSDEQMIEAKAKREGWAPTPVQIRQFETRGVAPPPTSAPSPQRARQRARKFGYMQHYRSRQAELKRAREAARERARKARQQRRSRRVMYAWLCCFARPCECAALVGVLVAMILAAVKLDHAGALNGSMAVLLAPCWLVVWLTMCTNVVFHALRNATGGGYDDYMERNLVVNKHRYALPVFGHFCTPYAWRKDNYVAAYAATLLAGAALALFLVRLALADATRMPYSYGVFVPLYLLLLGATPAPLCGAGIDGAGRICDVATSRAIGRGCFALLLVLLAAELAFVGAKLDHLVPHTVSWYLVFTPLWVMHGAAPLGLVLIRTFQHAYNTENEELAAAAFCCVLMVCFVPLEALLAAHAEADIDAPFGAMLTPLYVAFGCICCLWCFIACYASGKGRWP